MKRLVALLPVAAFFAACAEAPSPPNVQPHAAPADSYAVGAAAKDAKDKDKEAKKDDEPAATCDRLPKEWNLKVKSVAMRPGEVSITLEFTKDVDDKALGPAGTDLKALKFAFLNSRGVGSLIPKDKDRKDREPKKEKEEEEVLIARVYFFDSENVSIQTSDSYGGVIISKIDGEVSGTAPDAFRVTVMCDQTIHKRTKKLEIRPVKVPKP